MKSKCYKKLVEIFKVIIKLIQDILKRMGQQKKIYDLIFPSLINLQIFHVDIGINTKNHQSKNN